MYEIHFLRDIAEQNYSKYNIDPQNSADKGIMLSVNSSQAIGLAVTRFYDTLGDYNFKDLQPKFSEPTIDSTTKGKLVR